MLCLQITGRWVQLKLDSTIKSSYWHQVPSQWPTVPDLYKFATIASLQDLAILLALLSQACSSCPETALQQLLASCPEHSPDFLGTWMT